MINRRTTLKIGATGVLGGLMNFPLQAMASATATTTMATPSHVLFDSRIAESRAFANKLATKGQPVTDISSDLSDLWYRELRQQLLENRSPVIGLTKRLDLFCLEELARDAGMKVTLRIDHLIHEQGQVEHKINGVATGLLGNSASFGEKIAEISMSDLQAQTSGISAQKLSGPYSPKTKTALVTWVIA